VSSTTKRAPKKPPASAKAPATKKSSASKKPRAPRTEKPAQEGAARRERRERKRDKSREEIVEAARRVILRRGIAATTLDAVAEEVGLTKAALYYYYPSKDALLFDLVFDVFYRHAHEVDAGVAAAHDGASAIRAVIQETVRGFAGHLDDFRLVFMHNQVAGAGPGAVKMVAEQFARIRPLNELTYAGAARKLGDDWKRERGRAGVEPRMLTFLAHLAAIGVLTVKGMVEHLGDPLRYSDDELVDSLARIFEAAARP
jgi:AcrR family transcriptional regulator